MTKSNILNATQRETLAAIANTFVARLTPAQEETLINNTLKVPNNCFTSSQLSQFAQLDASSSDIIDRIEQKLPLTLSPKQINDFIMALNLLSYRPTSIAFTGTWTLFKDLSQTDRENVLLGWKRSSFAIFSKQLYNSLMGLCIISAYGSMETPLYKSLVYPGIEGGHAYFKQQPDYQKVNHERLHMLTTEEAKGKKKYDAIIIGSGAGGGVMAAELSKAGLSVLVIEKGKYYHQDEFDADNDEFALTCLFENGGTAPNSTGSVNFLTASTFGGGTTVNYLASIGPQQFVKEQWEQKGLPYFVSQQFEKDIESVCERIGASRENITHNQCNQKLMKGCEKLGLSAATMPQNTSGRPHHCGKCYTGCTSGIKNSTTNTFLKDAAANGAKFLDLTQVTRVLTKNNKAIGVACKIHGSTKEHYIYANTVVVSGGALNTPGLLLKSGLTNPHIGKDLRLHLSALMVAIYDDEINPSEGSLLTTVCDAFENYDGSTYGFKIECFSNGIGNYSAIVSWEGAAKHKQRVLRHRNSVTTFAMSRDMDSICNVKYDAYNKIDIDFSLSKHDGDNLKEGIVQMARIHTAAGARELHVSLSVLEPFVFEEGEESDVTNPRFLKWVESVYTQAPPTPASGHQMASCRMGTSPKNSATKPTGETWDVRNLYVADSSLFPTALGINPMVTIQAIALSVSRNIIASVQEAKL
ncbi:hypothetical protein INT48_000239 [Thamnidium elegans]|uniref:Long-chain-alcohol oxidase n=1 Tax=Thamnidium elegans TaxID=101142 RepID=A0A8H7VXH3_9FUNG|nr:hypothetical protein INT48_000239 [Thamnidium elegans]